MPELNNPEGVRQASVTEPSPEREWVSYVEAGELVGLSRGTLWKIISTTNEIEVARVGRAVRINRESLLSYMKRLANRSTGTAHE